ncbi:MAG TPA: methyltransferase domain-containing protein [Ilumatobacteraceae bacterium]|nr:methyltransferase domain-containing protein [Ilumatobacteraceae bacterium]
MAVVRYGTSIADDAELRLIGDVTGKRVLELGISTPSNAVVLAANGARALPADPSADRIAALRREAEAAEVTVQCHQVAVAELGPIASASIDVVVAAHSLDEVDDLARVLRQVHRILKPDASFVVAVRHPIDAIVTSADGNTIVTIPYGAGGVRSIGDWFMSMQRTNFAIDVVHELRSIGAAHSLTPTTLVLRAKKLGV